ncbi:hypothetical protein HDU82_001157 [Entophlyctis luteolus]|nr:hypothetical protein HDU82_001157 [Entophlyctis luteolus]
MQKMGPPSTNKKTPVSALSAKSDAKGRDTKAPVKQSANLKKQTFEEDVEGSKVSGRALDLAEGYCLSADQIEELMALDLDSSFEYYSIGKKSIVFQHHKLYRYAALHRQESVTLQIAVEVEIPLDPLPLDQAITLEEHEERLAKMQEAEELARLEKERREAEERAAAANPFDALEPEQVKRIAADTMAAMLQAVAEELDALVEDQRVRLLARAARICLGSAGDAKG